MADYLTPSEREAERLTVDTLKHDGQRYEVGIPWLRGLEEPDIEENRKTAEHRLNSLLSMLERKPAIKLQYAAVLQSHLKKGYTRLVPEKEAQGGMKQWFLPHFPVVREDKVTTKVRVVFDAAAQHKGKSINDHMHSGPKWQNDLVAVLLRFCAHPIAVAADITEMFLQVSLKPSDRKFHRFLWKESPDSPKFLIFSAMKLTSFTAFQGSLADEFSGILTISMQEFSHFLCFWWIYTHQHWHTKYYVYDAKYSHS